MEQIVAGLIRRGVEIVVVHQQSPQDPRPYWTLPGGVIEVGEFITDALTREIREETGLLVEQVGSLLYLVQQLGVNSTVWTGFIFDVHMWSGMCRPADPDGFILDVACVPVDEAIRRLEMLPWRMMREPILIHLSGQMSTPSLWLYQQQTDSDDLLIDRLTI